MHAQQHLSVVTEELHGFSRNQLNQNFLECIFQVFLVLITEPVRLRAGMKVFCLGCVREYEGLSYSCHLISNFKFLAPPPYILKIHLNKGYLPRKGQCVIYQARGKPKL